MQLCEHNSHPDYCQLCYPEAGKHEYTCIHIPCTCGVENDRTIKRDIEKD